MWRLRILAIVLSVLRQTCADDASRSVLEAVSSANSTLQTSTGFVSCDVAMDGRVCTNGGTHMLLPRAKLFGICGHYNFDLQGMLDASGNEQHGQGFFERGPSLPAMGSSAVFQSSFAAIPALPCLLEGRDSSYTFWFHLLRDAASMTSGSQDTWCPMLHRGGTENGTMFRAPSISYSVGHPVRIKVEMTTRMAASGGGWGEVFKHEAILSHGVPLRNSWNHVAVVRHGSRLRLYLNGILDSSYETTGDSPLLEHPVFVGGTEGTRDQCKAPLMMDELRIYNRALGRDEITAEAAPALAGVGPAYVRLGCLHCTLQEAIDACAEGYHICTSLEQHTGALQVARVNGWVSKDTLVWTRAVANGGGSASSGVALGDGSEAAVGLGICCADLH
ncbi:unnamed protein product [Vitrella brassicaformis CCMP3155]|uniref:DUF8019 domain-containing protein n=2 Tax=Vitrella brassicaformis TaxID=1169539 RepID=A0A0G4F402_VITBC|nr:unnamed protein product [Vitrella brassicaformis CCMP3155]|eukprot:CEM06955.1 unnamed protein product [Vitrella brassicaformis CCMP3155]